MKINIICNTDGKGYWSNVVKPTSIYKIEIRKILQDYGELKAYFHSDTWKINKDGLIYTDPLWIKDFRTKLKSLGFSSKAVLDIDYSEQGMQGKNYVSMDIGKSFIKEYNNIYEQIR